MKKLTIFLFAIILTGAGCSQTTVDDDNTFGGPDNGDILVEEITNDAGVTIPQGYFDVGACMTSAPECENMRVFIFGEYVEEIVVDNETMYADSSTCDSLGCTFHLDGDEWMFLYEF